MLVEVEVCDRIAVVEIIGRSGCNFLARFLWWHSSSSTGAVLQKVLLRA